MYQVSDAFLQAVQENTRKYKWTGKITTKSGVVYDIEPEQIVKGSGYISRHCCGNNEIELGSVYAAEMKMTLFLDANRYSLEDAKVELFYSLELADGTWEQIPMGVFDVSEANRNIKTIELVGYDYMLRFDKSASVDSTSGTPYALLSMACEKCDVELAHTEAEIEAMPNGAELLGVYPDGNVETYRDLIFYVAQVLGRVCQINRVGQLELKRYGNTPVVTMDAVHRFRSSYSDFRTRYTAVYSTNEMEAKSEYYCLDPDDGLTMNLGINPLLQYGLQKTREELLTNILNALAVVDYIPFDSETIGNPALDPMDVVRFTGGHADGDALSCITGITYKINGKHTLKGVGKNPLLSSAKSKADKNIIGLLNQVESTKFVICSFENAREIEVGAEPIRIIDIIFASVETTSGLFVGLVNGIVTAPESTVTNTYPVRVEVADEESIVARAVALAKQTEPSTETEPTVPDSGGDVSGTDTTSGTESTTDTTTDTTQTEVIPEITYKTLETTVDIPTMTQGTPIITFLYKLDDMWVEDYTPMQKVMAGENSLPLLYPLGSLGANTAKTLEVYMKVEGGTMTIAPSNCKAAVAGSGIAAGNIPWDGKSVVEETVGLFDISGGMMSIFALNDSVQSRLMTDIPGAGADTIGLYQIGGGVMTMYSLTDEYTI